MLSPEALKKIDTAITKYPPGRKASAVMAALTIAQDEKGWLAPETIEFVAGYLEMAPVAVYEVATFYSMYNRDPVGRYKITICTNLPCALHDSVKSAEYLMKKLGIGWNETTADGLITLKQGECFGACGDAPVLLVNDKRMCSFMQEHELDRLIDELRASGGNGDGRAAGGAGSGR